MKNPPLYLRKCVQIQPNLFPKYSQYHGRWWGEVLYTFSAQVPHIPFRSKHYSPWSPCTTTNGADCATFKGGRGRAKFQLYIRRQENSHSTFCIDIKIPEKSWGQCSYPSNIWTGPGIQTSGQRPRQENLVDIICKLTGTVSPGYRNDKRDKYSNFNSQNTGPKRIKSNIWKNIMQSETRKRGEGTH